MKKDLTLLAAILLFTATTTRPIPEYSANIVPVIVGLISAGSIHHFSGSYWGIPIGAATGALTYYIAHKFTPRGRIARAFNHMLYLEANPLANQTFQTDDQILNALQEYYLSYDWPLITGFKHLDDLKRIGEKASSLAQAAQDEDSTCTYDAKIIHTGINKMIRNITQCIKVIKCHPKYLEELKQFKAEERHNEKMRLERQKMAIEQQKANALTAANLHNNAGLAG